MMLRIARISEWKLSVPVEAGSVNPSSYPVVEVKGPLNVQPAIELRASR